MITLKTTLGKLELKNPVIISSSGLTNSAIKNLELERAGAGAIVLKSLFEEQMTMNTEQLLQLSNYTEAEDYISQYIQSETVGNYLQLIRETKKACTIPVIASINCYRQGEWIKLSKQIEEAGADALELNIFMFNMDKYLDSNKFEQFYIDILTAVCSVVSIPVFVKIGQQLTSLVSMSEKLKAAGAAGVVIFNRFYQPDIDLHTMTIKQGETFTSPHDFANTLRWTGIISGKIKDLPIISSTGIHSWENATKALLAGAQAVEICSTVYKNGNGIISQINDGIQEWMTETGYYTLEEFRGKLNSRNIEDPTLFERTQFMKYYASKF